MSSLIEKIQIALLENAEHAKYAIEKDDYDYYLGTCHGLQSSLDIIKQHSNWVSVFERLPADGRTVLVIDCGEVNFGQYSDGTWQAMGYGQYAAVSEVKYWQPLPQPPLSKVNIPELDNTIYCGCGCILENESDICTECAEAYQ